MSQEKIWSQIDFFKSLYYKLFRTSIELFSAFCRNFFDEVVKTAFYVSIATFKKKLKVFRCWAENHRHFWQTLRQSCHNCFPGVHGNKLSRKTFRWKPYIFLFPHWAESFHFCPKIFKLGCQNCILPGNKTILRRSILFEFFPYLLWTFSKKSSGFCRMFINWVVKTAFFVSRSVLCVEHLLQEICRVLFITFGLSDKKKLLCGRKITPFVKSAFWLSIGTIWGEVFFANLFWPLLEI